VRLDWVLLLAVGDEDAERKVLGHVEAAVGTQLEVDASQRYWKDETLARVVAHAELPDGEPPAVEALRRAFALSRSWIVNGGVDELAGVADGSFSVHGVEWASFAVPADQHDEKPQLRLVQ
jgi:hypothetical protein